MSNTYNWSDIENRAAKFATKWITETDEKGEAKTFWDDFLREIFNIERRKFMNFEKTQRRASTKRTGFIDLCWKGKFLVEHKSASKNSEKDFDDAFEQALDYVNGMSKEDRPRYVALCNFQRFRLYDFQNKEQTNFDTDDLPRHIKKFQFIPDAVNGQIEREIKANIEAAELMGRLHDAIEKDGYKGRDLEMLLVRLLFCLFAEDTDIFAEKVFTNLVNKNLADDGKTLGKNIVQLFDTLNMPFGERPSDTPKDIKLFPYVNGGLFDRPLSKTPNFTIFTLHALFKCCNLDWSEISPAIFGSLFQSVMNASERRHLGAHYTSEAYISRLIDPLFMESLWAEFNAVRSNLKKLRAFHEKLGKLKFFDPACGCGNFLVVTYKDLRLLELEIIKTLFNDFTGDIDRSLVKVNSLRQIKLGNFYGIEIEESSFLIAQTAMWLADHQCNQLLNKEFGEYIPSVPLPKGASIRHGNSLTIDWQKEFPNVDFIIGNPPFVGHHYQNEVQKVDLRRVFKESSGIGVLDYVSCWYKKAVEYMKATPSVKTAFVSTNSISQGEQVGLLWSELFKSNITIQFAHQTFKWNNEAKGVAAVHCVIIGFANKNAASAKKYVFEYDETSEEPRRLEVKNISPYLVEGSDVFVTNRSTPICEVPKMIWGNKPTDGGNFLFENLQVKNDFLKIEPLAAKWIKPYMGGDDFINNKKRWCLWLKDATETDLKKLPEVAKRVEKVKEMRLSSKAEATKKKAITPTLFSQIAQPNSNYLAIPEVSSERRTYIPIDFVDKNTIASNTVQLIPNADLFLFGILTSKMHMAWVKYVCGRLKSDYRYSNTIVYNNYPFPENTTPPQKQKVETSAQMVLDVRKKYEATGSSLAHLYDPLSMPPDLKAAHDVLDKAVDDCYGKTKFMSDAKRVGYLFELYDGLVKGEKGKK